MSWSAYPLGCSLDHRGIVVWFPAGGKQFLSSPDRPDWLWGPPDLTFNVTSAQRQLGLEAGHSPVSSDEVKDWLGYSSTPHSCVLGPWRRIHLVWRGIPLIAWRGIHLIVWGGLPLIVWLDIYLICGWAYLLSCGEAYLLPCRTGIQETCLLTNWHSLCHKYGTVKAK